MSKNVNNDVRKDPPIKKESPENQTGLMLFARNNDIFFKFYLNEFLHTIFGSITFTFGPEK